MFSIGTHLSSSNGYLNMGKDALAIGANTFQFFTRNPRGSKAKAPNPEDMTALCHFLSEHSFAPIVAHAPYTMNACSADPELRNLAAEMFAEDLERMEYLPNNFYNFHPGNHVKQGTDVGIELIAQLLNRVLKPEQKTMVLLETMSGKGTEIGRNFSELRAIIDRVELSEHLGICFDSCHLSDAGYDLNRNLDGVLEEFDKTIGLDRLKAFHINDSLNPIGSHKDRHACIGEGTLGLETMITMINHPALRHLPFILETPLELDGHAREIALLKEHFRENESAIDNYPIPQ